MTSFIDYANQQAIRNKPLNPELVKALGFLPEMGVTMQVFSGGQDAHGPNRTGSRRHDHGQSADVFFYKDGKKLDWRNPSDVPVFQDIVTRSRANGVTGFGAGDGYMQPGSMHIGFGKPAVWGAQGKGANAPGWLRSAASGQGLASLPPSQQTEQMMPKPNSVMAKPNSVSPAPPMGTAMTGFAPQQAPQAPQMAASVNPMQGAAGMPSAQPKGLAGLFGPKPGGASPIGGMAQALMSGMGGMAQPQQQMAPANFVVPAAEPGMLNPTPQGLADPRMAALLKMLQQQA